MASGWGVRVLMVSQRMPPHRAGAEMQALGLSRALLDEGVDVRVVTTRYRGGLTSRTALDGISVRRLGTLRPGSGPSAAVHLSRAAAMAWYVARNAFGFDVVHAHCVSASSLGALVGARTAGVPVIVKPSIGHAEGELAALRATFGRKAAAVVLRGAARFAVIDPQIERELRALGVDDDRIEVVDNGIDPRRFHPVSPSVRDAERRRLELPDGPLALFVGRLLERKGVRQLALAWSCVRDAIPSADLLVVGEGDQALADLARASGAITLGARDDVDALMRCADVFVLPSANESFGNVVLEAMASGLPVVTSATGLARRLPLDGRAGFIVDPGDPRAIAAALVQILGRPDLGQALGGRAQMFASAFHFPNIARRYVEIYQGLVRDPVWAFA